MTQDAKSTNAGRRGLIRACVLATFAGLLLAAVAAHPGDAQARTPKPWTRTVQVRLTAEKLGLPASTSARRLARAALRRVAPRLRLSRSLAGIRLERDLRTPPGPAGGHSSHSLRFQQTFRGRRVLWSQIDVLVSGREVDLIRGTVVPVGSGRSARHPRGRPPQGACACPCRRPRAGAGARPPACDLRRQSWPRSSAAAGVGSRDAARPGDTTRGTRPACASSSTPTADGC